MSYDSRKAMAQLPTWLRPAGGFTFTKDPAAPIAAPVEHSQSSSSHPASESPSPPSHDPAPAAAPQPPIEDEEVPSLKRKKSAGSTSAASELATRQPAKVSSFQGVIEHSVEGAKEFAMEMENCVLRTDKIHRHVYWADGSIVQGVCGTAAVVWKDPSTLEWMEKTFPYLYCIQNTEIVEMYAIAHALRLEIDEIQLGRNVRVAHKVFVFTNSIGALNAVKMDALGFHKPKNCQQAHTIIGFSTELSSLGTSVELRLVPGHKGVPGNVRAHQAAKMAAHRLAAKAGIKSREKGFEFHLKQGHVAIAPQASHLVPASPVPVHGSKGAGVPKGTSLP